VGVREVGQWIGYLSTSAWSILWVSALVNHADGELLRLQALGFSSPLVLLALLGARLERRFGAAYTGLYGGLAQMLPRMSGVLVFVVLAIIAVPLFPGFFAMLATVIASTAAAPIAALVLVSIWLLWSWAGVRLLQGLIVGPANGQDVPDLSLVSTGIYSVVLAVLIVGGLYTGGVLL
jgi:NADH:ubiquinone oxidoreductase subunit 4 (subunit M)